MKTLKYAFILVIAIVTTMPSFAVTPQSAKKGTQTETFKVWGKCNLCKARIEKAAKIKGVSVANWNPQTKMIRVTYNTSETSCDAIQKSIAAAGHDTRKFRASDKAYNAIPSCCHYTRKK